MSKSAFQHFLDAITRSGIFLSLGASLTTYMSTLILNLKFDLGLFLASFLITFSIYNFNRKTDEKEDFISYPERFSFVVKYSKYLFGGALISCILAILIALSRGIETAIVLIIPLAIATLYGVSWVPKSLNKKVKFRRFKEIPIFKDLLVALGWFAIPFLTVYYWSGSITIATWLIALFIFIRIYIGATVFDVRDIIGDKLTGIKTLPVLIGEKKTMFFLAILNTLSLFFFLYITLQGLLPPFMNVINIGVSLYGYLFLYLAIIKINKKFLCDVIVDGEYSLLGLLAFLGVTFYLLIS